MTSTAVVILNYNGEKLLREFLPSVIRHSPEAEVVVADNGSTDQSLQLLKLEFPQVRVIALDKNYGFCGGYNRALQQITATYCVLLNSDVEVTEGWLRPLIALLDGDSSIGAVQPKILSYKNRNIFEYAGAGGGIIDILGYPFCRGRIFDHVETDTGQYDDEREVFWASGACVMVRKAAYHAFGGLDEDLFAHMEEIDLCWKMQRASMKIWYSGKSTVYHLGAGTLGYQSPHKTYLNFRNGLVLIHRHLDTSELLYKLPFRMALDWLAALVFLVKGQASNAGSVLQAHGDFLKALSQNGYKRRKLHSRYPTYPRQHIHPGLIIFDYYLRGRKTVSPQ